MESPAATPETKSLQTADDPLLIDYARQSIYQFLSLAFSDPMNGSWERLTAPEFLKLVQAASEVVQTDPSASIDELAPGELPAQYLDMASVQKHLGAHKGTILEEFDRAFGLMVSKECPPFETEFCPQTLTVYRMQTLADIGGFYKAFGLESSRSRPERQDHIALELEFMAWLIAKEIYAVREGLEESAQVCRSAQTNFVTNHLAWWTPAFAFALRRKVDGIQEEGELLNEADCFLGAAASLLAAFVAAERAILEIPRPTELVSPISSVEPGGQSCEGCHAVNLEL
ncbi:MAG: molecular chaperone TorD family protein [Planctomycetota bacterium]|nr:molecular chaperone TorD family protein [Planctomycetota bacterium]MDA1142915.1 molecular chaperone TorD family protein [Planctomycetota bacterium]